MLDGPWEIVSIDLLQLPRSHQGSTYLLMCVDNFSRYVILKLKLKFIGFQFRYQSQGDSPQNVSRENPTPHCGAQPQQ